MQKYIVDLNAKMQLKMTKMQIDAQKVIAENQMQSEERIMKHHREDMRSLAVILARKL